MTRVTDEMYRVARATWPEPWQAYNLETALRAALEAAAAVARPLLVDDGEASAKLGRFDHHPDPAIDFEIEVQSLQARLFDAKGSISKPGTKPENVADVLAGITSAMSFRVGGDPSAVAAKSVLRELEVEAKAAIAGEISPAQTSAEVRPLGFDYRGTLMRVTAILTEFGMPPEGEVDQFEWLRERLSTVPSPIQGEAVDLSREPTDGPISLREEVEMSRTTLIRYCLEAQAGRYPADAREFERRADAAFRNIRVMLASQSATPAGVREITDDWLRDTAMNVMLATEVEEAERILRAALAAAQRNGE